jgi:hypothetical protein
MVNDADTLRRRSTVLDELALLASASAQTEYEKDVPQAFIAGELIERFATDVYRPKSPEFVAAFTEPELKELAQLYGLVHAAAGRLGHERVQSVQELQKLQEWRQVMSLAKTLHDSLQRA